VNFAGGDEFFMIPWFASYPLFHKGLCNSPVGI